MTGRAYRGGMLVVARHDVDGIWWESARRPPDPRLAGLVTDAVGYAEYAVRPVARRVTPHPAVTVIVNLGPSIQVDGAAYSSFVAGMHTGWGMTEFTGAQCGIELGLTPHGAYRLFGLPPAELAGQVTALPLLDTLADRLAGTPDWASRLDVVENALIRAAVDGPDPDPAVDWAWRVMRRRRGAVRVSELADEIGWSRRHFTSRFRAEVGLAPKVAARVLRFHEASALLARGVPAATVAARCGYTDQSHLVREFRALAGCTPGEYVAELDAEQVTFVQDREPVDGLTSAA
jgi:AraC-like DNA-binding protein